MPISKNRMSERRTRRYGEDAELLVRTQSSESGLTAPDRPQESKCWGPAHISPIAIRSDSLVEAVHREAHGETVFERLPSDSQSSIDPGPLMRLVTSRERDI